MIKALKNNALFLSCWYERSRPVFIACLSVFIFSVMSLWYLNVSMDQYRNVTITIYEAYFHILVIIKSLVLLVQGTVFAWLMGARERTCETLDFHRNSPQAVGSKIIGLLFGSTWYEWSVFGLISLLELFFVLISVIPIHKLFLFNISLIMSGLLFHTTAITLSLISSSKKNRYSPFLMILIIWLIGPLYMSMESSPFFAHLFGMTAFKYINPKEFTNITGWFFTLDLPLIFLQALIQIPLLVLMGRGLRRIFCMPNSPAWSKADIIRWCSFIIFMLTGFFVAQFMHFGDLFLKEGQYGYYYGYHRWMYYGDPLKSFLEGQVYLFMIVYVALGVIASIFVVPSYFKTAKYAVSYARGFIRNQLFLDDGASSLFSIAVYIFMAGVFFLSYLLGMHGPYFLGCFTFLWISSYIVGFAGFLEYFRLSKYRGNKIVFITIILLFWVFLPWIGSIIFNFDLDNSIILTSWTPFVGVGYAISMLFGERALNMAAFFIPWIFALLVWVFAYFERTVVEKARHIQIKK